MDPEVKGEEQAATFKTSTYKNLLDRNLQLSQRLEQVTADYQIILKQAQDVNVKYENTIKTLKLQLEKEKRANVELRKQLDFTEQIQELDASIIAVDDVLKKLFEKKRFSEIPPSQPLTTPPLAKKDPAVLSDQELNQIRINQDMLKRRQRVNRISFHYAIKDPRFQTGHAQFSHSKEYHCKLRQANKEWKEKIYKAEKAMPGYIDQKYLQLASENGWPLVDTGEDSVSSTNTSEVDILEEKFTDLDVDSSQPPVLDYVKDQHSLDYANTLALKWAKESVDNIPENSTRGSSTYHKLVDSFTAQILENEKNTPGFITQNRD